MLWDLKLIYQKRISDTTQTYLDGKTPLKTQKALDYFWSINWSPRTFIYKPRMFDFFSRKLLKSKYTSPLSNLTLFYYTKRENLFFRKNTNKTHVQLLRAVRFSRRYLKSKILKNKFLAKNRRHANRLFINMRGFFGLPLFENFRQSRIKCVNRIKPRTRLTARRVSALTKIASWYFESPLNRNVANNVPRVRTARVFFKPTISSRFGYAPTISETQNTFIKRPLGFALSQDNFKRPRFSGYKLFPHDTSRTNHILVNRFIRTFRLVTTALFNYTPIRRQILQYNLMRIYRPFESMKRNLTAARSNRLVHNLKRVTSPLNISPLRVVKRKRRVKTLWMAYVTRLMITPQRHEFMIMYRKRFMYQKKVSKYVLKFYRFKVLEAVQNYEFGLVLFLVRSWFAITPKLAETMISSGLVYINGTLAINKSIMLYGGDLLQLVIQRSYFMFHKWTSIYYRLRLSRFRYFANFWRIRSMRPYPKDISRRIPHWILYYKIIIEEIPFYIELDFTTLSAILLRSYVNNPAYYHYFSLRETPFAVIRMYNWKSFV